MKRIKQLAAAVMAFDPLIARQALAGENLDWDRVRKVIRRLCKERPGLRWAIVTKEGERLAAYVYDDLLEAAEDCDPDQGFLVACKVEDKKLHLSMDGKWVAFDAQVAAWESRSDDGEA